MQFLLPTVTRTFYQQVLPAPIISTIFYRAPLLTGHFQQTTFLKATLHRAIFLTGDYALLFQFSRYAVGAMIAHALAVVGNHGGLQCPSPLGAMEDIMIDDFL